MSRAGSRKGRRCVGEYATIEIFLCAPVPYFILYIVSCHPFLAWLALRIIMLSNLHIDQQLSYRKISKTLYLDWDEYINFHPQARNVDYAGLTISLFNKPLVMVAMKSSGLFTSLVSPYYQHALFYLA
uniref:Uncharacterized protein n=1 Tax=Glossina pallidipes TaxID=7398 RepID=A0A1A9ZVQ5_GLOPL